MKWVCTTIWWLGVLIVAIVAVSALKLGPTFDSHLAAGHLVDWVTGGVCLVWLLVLLKAPWDLYFQAHAALFEFQRSRERDIPVTPGREEYVRALRRRLGWFAVGAHLLSATLAVCAAQFTGGQVGYWFAAFFLVSTAFRPTAALYGYLAQKLCDILREVQYPREDVAEVRQRLLALEAQSKSLARQSEEARDSLVAEQTARQEDSREVRQSLHAIGREFETTVSRVTDNQEVIRGIQAFVRLVVRSPES